MFMIIWQLKNRNKFIENWRHDIERGFCLDSSCLFFSRSWRGEIITFTFWKVENLCQSNLKEECMEGCCHQLEIWDLIVQFPILTIYLLIQTTWILFMGLEPLKVNKLLKIMLALTQTILFSISLITINLLIHIKT